MPATAPYSQLYSFTREEKKIKGRIGSSKKTVVVKDFRGNDMYEEDMTALKERVEKYIASHADLGEPTKNNLRELKVTAGATKEEVELLSGGPDKVIKTYAKANNTASEIWIYRINKINVFIIFIVPVFWAHEGYYLHFKDNILTAIERHYLEQTVHQTSAPGVGVGGIRPKKKP
jgi:hypothetical protein